VSAPLASDVFSPAAMRRIFGYQSRLLRRLDDDARRQIADLASAGPCARPQACGKPGAAGRDRGIRSRAGRGGHGRTLPVCYVDGCRSRSLPASVRLNGLVGAIGRAGIGPGVPFALQRDLQLPLELTRSAKQRSSSSKPGSAGSCQFANGKKLRCLFVFGVGFFVAQNKSVVELGRAATCRPLKFSTLPPPVKARRRPPREADHSV
jgi:hypothetical protein